MRKCNIKLSQQYRVRNANERRWDSLLMQNVTLYSWIIKSKNYRALLFMHDEILVHRGTHMHTCELHAVFKRLNTKVLLGKIRKVFEIHVIVNTFFMLFPVFLQERWP